VGTAITEKYLTRLKDDYAKGNGELEAAQRVAPEPYRSALAGECRVGETIQRSVQTVLHLITWIELRDQFFAAGSQAERELLARKLDAVALEERANAKALLPRCCRIPVWATRLSATAVCLPRAWCNGKSDLSMTSCCANCLRRWQAIIRVRNDRRHGSRPRVLGAYPEKLK